MERSNPIPFGTIRAVDIYDMWATSSSEGDSCDSADDAYDSGDEALDKTVFAASPQGCSSDDASVENWPRRALSRSAGHGCVHTRPVQPAPRGAFMKSTAYANWQVVRKQARSLLHAVVLKRLKVVWPALFCDALLGKLSDFSLDPDAFRSWLAEHHREDFEDAKEALDGWTRMLEDRPELRERAVNEPNRFFTAHRAEMKRSRAWNEQRYSRFFDLARRFIEVKAKHLSGYFCHLMDNQREHLIWRFDRLTESHTRFVNRVVTHLQTMDDRSFQKALQSYTSAQMDILEQQRTSKDGESAGGSLAQAYRGAAMVKHGKRSTTKASSSKEVCNEARLRSHRKLRPLEYSPHAGKFFDNGLASDFIDLEEAHVGPASKIFSCYGRHFAKACGLKEDELVSFNRTLELHVTHNSVFGQDAEQRFQAKVDELGRRALSDAPNERRGQLRYAGKVFMLIERCTLTETGSTNHMHSYGNQKTDHLSESKAHGQGVNAGQSIAQRLAGAIHSLLGKRAVTNEQGVVRAHGDYLDSVKRACVDCVVETSKQVYASHAATIRRAMGLVGAVDHLSAVYNLESRHLGEIKSHPDVSFDDAVASAADWIQRSAAECGVVEIWRGLQEDNS